MLRDFPIDLPAYIIVEVNRLRWQYSPAVAATAIEPCVAVFEDQRKAEQWRDNYVVRGSVWEITEDTIRDHLEVFRKNGFFYVAINPFDDAGPATKSIAVATLCGLLGIK